MHHMVQYYGDVTDVTCISNPILSERNAPHEQHEDVRFQDVPN